MSPFERFMVMERLLQLSSPSNGAGTQRSASRAAHWKRCADCVGRAGLRHRLHACLWLLSCSLPRNAVGLTAAGGPGVICDFTIALFGFVLPESRKGGWQAATVRAWLVDGSTSGVAALDPHFGTSERSCSHRSFHGPAIPFFGERELCGNSTALSCLFMGYGVCSRWVCSADGFLRLGQRPWYGGSIYCFVQALHESGCRRGRTSCLCYEQGRFGAGRDLADDNSGRWKSRYGLREDGDAQARRNQSAHCLLVDCLLYDIGLTLS